MSGLCLDTGHAVAAFAGVPLTKPRYDVVEDVLRERHAQDVKWGEQNHPDGTGPDHVLVGPAHAWIDNAELAERARDRCDRMHKAGKGTWEQILTEEATEAYAEADPEKLRAELIQVAAVAVAWVEAIDRRTNPVNGRWAHRARVYVRGGLSRARGGERG